MSLPGGQFYALHIHWKDGGKDQRYSRDKKRKDSKSKDETIGLIRLLRHAAKHEHKAENIAIYDHRPGNPPDGKLIYQKNRGELKICVI